MLPSFAIDDGGYVTGVYFVPSSNVSLLNAITGKLSDLRNVTGGYLAIANTFASQRCPSAAERINRILRTVSKVEVIGVYARFVVAMMANNFAIRDTAISDHHGGAVSREVFVSMAEFPVSIRGNKSEPRPTLGLHMGHNGAALVNQSTETIFERIGERVRRVYTPLVFARLEKLCSFLNGRLGNKLNNYLSRMEKFLVVEKEGLAASAPCSNPNPAPTRIGFVNLFPKTINVLLGKIVHIGISLLDFGHAPGHCRVAGAFLCLNYSTTGVH